MNHHELKEKLLVFYDPELPEEERREIAGHLPSCEECRHVLRRWERISNVLSCGVSASTEPSETFVNRVMARLAVLEEAQRPAGSRASFLKWLLPALGYGFAFFLMFLAISQRELPVNTETVLLSDISQASRWTFQPETPDMNLLVGP